MKACLKGWRRGPNIFPTVRQKGICKPYGLLKRSLMRLSFSSCRLVITVSLGSSRSFREAGRRIMLFTSDWISYLSIGLSVSRRMSVRNDIVRGYPRWRRVKLCEKFYRILNSNLSEIALTDKRPQINGSSAFSHFHGNHIKISTK